MDDALAEIERLPGRTLYFLDDHLLGAPVRGRAAFDGMRGMGRLFQGASTVDAILRGDAIEQAARAGLRSLFVGFETLNPENLRARTRTEPRTRLRPRIRRLDDLGVMINGSFVFGLDGDGPDVFGAHRRLGRLARDHHRDVPRRHALPGHRVLPRRSPQAGSSTATGTSTTRVTSSSHEGHDARRLEAGYRWAYRAFYEWTAITRASTAHASLSIARSTSAMRRLEEIRARVGRRDSRQAVARDAADARSRVVEGRAGRR